MSRVRNGPVRLLPYTESAGVVGARHDSFNGMQRNMSRS